MLRFFKVKNERKCRKKNFRSIVMKDKRFKVIKGVVNKKEGVYLYKKWNYSSNKNQISDDKVEQNKIESNQSEDWLVIPYSYEINDIIYQAHTSAGSHLSIQKTLEEIRKIGYRWENYESYVRQFWLDWDIWGGRHQ